MNYRHAFHAGNHADVLKHIVLLALCDALTAKPTPCYALDTHAGRGLYALDGNSAQRTRESQDGIGRLLAEAPRHPLVTRYLAAIKACRSANGPHAYPGSPWLLAHALRADDRITCCELQPEEAQSLQSTFARDPRVAVHERDGYAALKALLPPKIGATKFARGLVLIDPPYEAQLDEFDAALAALREGLERWPQGTFALWYPIKLRRTLHLFYRNATKLQSKSTLAGRAAGAARRLTAAHERQRPVAAQPAVATGCDAGTGARPVAGRDGRSRGQYADRMAARPGLTRGAAQPARIRDPAPAPA